MKEYEVKYQLGNNILLKTVKALNELTARYLFYTSVGGGVDILEIKELKDET